MTLRTSITALLLLLCTAAFAADRAELDAFMRAHIARQKIPGMVVGLWDGKEEWTRAYGLADLENGTPMRADSSFRLASVTKTMTAVAILQLVERGKISLDAEVQRYVPYFPRKTSPITVRQLLGHLAGIPHYVNRATEQHIKEHKTTREAIAIFENYDLVAEPGTRYSYSSYGYNLLGAAIEGASGQSYGAYMREHIWAPLQMNATRLDDPIALIPNRVRGYQLVDGQLANSEFIDISSRFAAGGLRTTVPDLLRFARGLMNHQLINAASLDLLTTSMVASDGLLTGYGMGCFVLPIDTNGRFAITNDGGQQETRTFIAMFPAHNVALATAMNAEINGDGTELRHIAWTLFGDQFDFTPTASVRAERIVLAAMQSAFTNGLADLQAHPVPTEGRASLPVATKYFNAIVAGAVKGGSETELLSRIAMGREPKAGSPLIVLGRSIAESLRNPREYSKRGAMEFFRDASMRSSFHPWLKARLARFAEEWTAATPADVRGLFIDRGSDPELIERTLRTTLRGRTVIPNMSAQLADLATSYAVAADPRAGSIAQLAADLYVAEPVVHRANAYARVAAGDMSAARAAMRLAARNEVSPEESADRINRTAYSFASAGRVDRAAELLVIATEQYPGVANLFDSLGEMYARNGDRERAIAAYRKALEIDPKMASSREALEKLK